MDFLSLVRFEIYHDISLSMETTPRIITLTIRRVKLI
jgi:hypothetical protein